VERPDTTPWGEFRAIVYRDKVSNAPHIALVHGTISPETEALVRVHEPTSVLDVLCEDPTAHSWTVAGALRSIAAAPSGVLVLMNCQDTGSLIFEQCEACSRGTAQQSVRHADSSTGLRTFGIGAQILRDLNVGQARLLARP